MEGKTVKVEHLSHQHPLLLKQDVMMYGWCGVCSKSNEISTFYVCESCGYYIHKECAELPQQINHPFHPSHPLSLVTDRNRNNRFYPSCDSCHRYRPFHQSPWYECNRCNFYMDYRCATMEPIRYEDDDDANLLRHFSHQHPMPLLAEDELRRIQDNHRCHACQRDCLGVPTHGCKTCDCFLHKSCAEAPREIQHPFHPRHSLSLSETHTPLQCKLCGMFGTFSFAYKCLKCTLWLCTHCATDDATHRSRPIRYKFHEHPLFFVDTFFSMSQPCSAYETYCSKPVLPGSDELDCTRSFVHRCLECDFTLHLLCGPLPSTIKHDCHVDPLFLVDSLVEDDYPDDEWYCDVCEKKRDPRVCVYYCKDCKFIAHVHCVASEIAKVLKGDLGNAKLKTVGEEGDYECEIYSNDQLVLIERSNSGV